MLELQARPSAWLRAAVLVLAVLAGASVLRSALPAGWLLLVPLLAAVAWRGLGAHAGLVLRFGGDGTLLAADGPAGQPRQAELLAVEERGALLVVVVRVVEPRVAANGGACSSHAASTPRRNRRSRRWRRPALRLCFGPDTAPAAARRMLRLWQQRHAGAPDGALAAVGLR